LQLIEEEVRSLKNKENNYGIGKKGMYNNENQTVKPDDTHFYSFFVNEENSVV